MSSVSTFREDSIRGFLHSPEDANGYGLVLTHGAGCNCQAPLLVAVAEAFSSIGFTVLRCNLRFRQERPFGPPFPAQAADDRLGLKDAVAAIRQLTSGRVFLGGHSYGGRQASMLVSEDPGAADALLLLSYPLHPPKKPQQMRTAHFANLRNPALFVHGTKDPFGTIEEIRSALELIPAATRLSTIEQAGHDLARGQIDIVNGIVKPFLEIVHP